ncbi:hypothetical protein NA57DRAFT_74904 [Rhizodiscina lignyota]|uniref:Uncharacterized protein n=1 Tax=Rhizodiscina lignyota TaxID=1504668 RepID=A0A9P4IEG2_9PEZI|nr:hypothetical protein NA57DRAFT_74904 [Rhizodiscina lignyota]
MSETINAVYIVLRKDFDHHTDRKGRLALPIGAYSTVTAANDAAKAHCTAEARKGPDYGDGPEHEMKDGLYKGSCTTRQDRRDNFEVWVKMMKLGDVKKTTKRKSQGEAGDGAVAKKGKAAAPSTTS